MREKRDTLVVTFPTTAAALRLEREAGAAGLPGRLIPVPRAITAGCGLAWAAPPESGERLAALLAERGIPWEGSRVMPV